MNFVGALAVIISTIFCVTCDSVMLCNISDEECLKKSTNIIYSKFIEGNPKIGTDNLEPMYHDIIEGNLSTLKYKFTNTTLKGFRNCKTEHVKLDLEALTLNINLICKAFAISGKYDISGRLIVLPVEGNGDYRIDSGKYRISIDSEIVVSPGKDGKNYMSMKNFKQKSEALESVKFDFKNLFNGREDLAEVVLKFGNENWREVSKEFQDPVFDASVKKIMKNGNKFLKSLPLEEFISS